MDRPSWVLGHATRRGIVGAVILGAHLLLLAVVAHATLQPAPLPEAPALTVSIVQPPPVAASRAPLPTPRLTKFAVQIPVPVLTVQLPPSAQSISAQVTPQPAPAAMAGPVVAQGPIVISEVAYLRQPQPRYPNESRHAHEEGLVVLRVLIDASGHAQQVTVLHSSGHRRLDDAACDAVIHALFKPHLTDGVPHEALATVPVEFSLHRA